MQPPFCYAPSPINILPRFSVAYLQLPGVLVWIFLSRSASSYTNKRLSDVQRAKDRTNHPQLEMSI